MIKQIFKIISPICILSIISIYANAESIKKNDLLISLTKDPSVTVNFKDTASNSLLSSDKLFEIIFADETKLSSTDFKINSIDLKDNHIYTKLLNEKLDANIDIYIDNSGRYASYSLTFIPHQTISDIANVSILPSKTKSPFVYGSINSSPIISDNLFIVPENPLINTKAYEGGITITNPIKLPFEKDKQYSYKLYIGKFKNGQLRRNFNEFMNIVRARPYSPYLHYNSWLDIGFFTPYTEKDALTRINQIGEELSVKRHVKLSAYLFDDGWDDRTGNWKMSKDFPNQFYPLKKEAEKYNNANLGLWLSPWGGYGKPRTERVSHAKEFGLETIDGKFALSGPIYYKNFHDRILDMIDKQNITFFKLDGTGNADKVIQGSEFTSDFDAAIHLIQDMRKANSNLFINLTTGTQASPSWLFYADSIWRDGDDINFYGPGSEVQRWITYRDAETYRSIVQKGPLFPINSLMLHGLVYAKQAEHLNQQSDKDFSDQAWTYFATGTQLQELYITPDLLNTNNWDNLADAAKWSQTNKDVLLDNHWIGGDPTLLRVYGWAALNEDKAIISLRNPDDKKQSYYLDLNKDLESNGQYSYNTKIVYGSNSTIPEKIDKPIVIELQPFESIVIDLQDIKR